MRVELLAAQLRLVSRAAVVLVPAKRDDHEQEVNQRPCERAGDFAGPPRPPRPCRHGLIRVAAQQRVAQLREGDEDVEEVGLHNTI